MPEPLDPPPPPSGAEAFLDEYIETPAQPIDKPPPVRKGLPTSYRMRHDAHYVDELEARYRISELPTSAANRTASETALAFPTSIPVTFALKDMSLELDGVASCFNLVDVKARPLRERLGLTLARVGVQRGMRSFHALRFLLEDPALELEDVALNTVLERTLSSFDEELHLTETRLRLRLHDSPMNLKGDARLLALAIQACTGTLLALIEASGRGGILDVCSTGNGDSVHCELGQDIYRMSPEQFGRMTDLEWTERPGGIPAGIALAAAARIAQAHGGHLEAHRKESGGCVFRLSFPANASQTPPASRG
jgi:hypothetical protein